MTLRPDRSGNVTAQHGNPSNGATDSPTGPEAEHHVTPPRRAPLTQCGCRDHDGLWDAIKTAATVADDARSALLADLLGRVAGCFPGGRPGSAPARWSPGCRWSWKIIIAGRSRRRPGIAGRIGCSICCRVRSGTARAWRTSRRRGRRELAQQTAGQRHPEPEDEPPAVVEWWRQFEADLAAVHRAIEGEHQAAIAAGEPWPPERNPQPEAEPVSEPESSPGAGQEADGRSGPDDQAARLDGLRGQATEAARRFTAEKAAREARAECAARLDRDACAEPERTVQAQASYEADMEL